MKNLLILTLLSSTVLVSCNTTLHRGTSMPKRALSLDRQNDRYATFDSPTTYDYADPNAMDGNGASRYYRTVYANAPAGQTKAVRNIIAKEMISLIDENHAIYHESLRRTLTTNSIAGEFLTLGLTSAGAIASGAQATRILSGVATGTNGFSGKLNGHILQQQTLSTVLKAIRLRKEGAYARMAQNFDKAADIYTLEDVVIDLGRYWEAGLLSSGIQQLDEMASEKIKDVEKEKDAAAGVEKKEAANVLKAIGE